MKTEAFDILCAWAARSQSRGWCIRPPAGCPSHIAVQIVDRAIAYEAGSSRVISLRELNAAIFDVLAAMASQCITELDKEVLAA